MRPKATKRRRTEDEVRRPKKKMRVKKQTEYHSSSEEDEHDPRADVPTGANSTAIGPRQQEKPHPKPILKRAIPTRGVEAGGIDDDKGNNQDEEGELEKNTAFNAWPGLNSDEAGDEEAENEPHSGNRIAEPEEDDDEDGDDDEDDKDDDSDASLTSSQAAAPAIHKQRKKRNDPSAFATSIAKILDTKLTTSKRPDPILSRSRSAAEANRSLSDARLENKARAQLRAEKKQALEKGRVKDVLGLETEGADTGAILDEEKRLKKTAQRGVVKLFNAVRAAQVKAEEAMQEARKEGVVGMGKREERVTEMSKQGFLELISRGGKKAAAAAET